MNRRARTAVLTAATVASFLVAVGGDALAASPTVRLDRSTAHLGERVVVTLHDWPLRSSVVVALCGNAARRGTADCDLEHSAGVGLSDADPVQITELKVTTPPVPCPCVVRVANATQSTVVDVPIEVPELPVAAVVGNDYRLPLVLTAHVERVSDGFVGSIRSYLGGRTAYRFTVQISNRSAEEYPGLRVRALASRGGSDQARVIEIPAPGTIGAGQTWRHSERVTLAAPVVGRFVWRVSASGAGPVLKDDVASYHFPFLLYLLAVGFVADVAFIGYRWVRHRRVRKSGAVLLLIGLALRNASR